MEGNHQFALILAAAFVLAMACSPASATDWPAKGKPVPEWKQKEKTPVQAPPVQAPSPYSQRAVTRKDYGPLGRGAPGADRAHVTRTRPVTGGAGMEPVSPAERRTPSTLRHRDRAGTGHTSDKKKRAGSEGIPR